MGWTYARDYKGGGIRAYFDREFSHETKEKRFHIIKSALVKMSRYYAAMKETDKATGKERIWAVVALVEYKPKAADGFTLGWKEMDESMGPTVIDYPLNILDLLTDPPPNDDVAPITRTSRRVRGRATYWFFPNHWSFLMDRKRRAFAR